VSIDYDMDVKYQRRCKPTLGISWRMAAMFRDVVVVVGRTRSRSMHGIHGIHAWVSISTCGSVPIVMVLRLAALRAAGAPL